MSSFFFNVALVSTALGAMAWAAESTISITRGCPVCREAREIFDERDILRAVYVHGVNARAPEEKKPVLIPSQAPGTDERRVQESAGSGN